MEITSQLAIFLANKPGTLAAVCEEIAKLNVNIFALTISDTIDHSVIRMVVSEPQKVLHMLEEHGTLVVENDVLVFEANNKPGVFCEIAKKLGNAGINIEYSYFSALNTSEKSLVVLRVNDSKRALELLGK